MAEKAGRLSAVGSRELPANLLVGGVRTILENRIARVPTWARALLERAAAAGRQLDLRILETALARESLSQAGMEAWLSACADLAILEVSDQVWRFSHDKLREFILKQIEQRGQLPQVHRAVALAIEASFAGAERDAHAAALALHFSQAREAASAARYGLRAGERALNGGALAEAIAQLQATLRHQGLCATDVFDGVLCRRLLGTALFALGRMEECVHVLRDIYVHVGHPLPRQASGRVGVVARCLATHAARRVLPSLRLTPQLSHNVLREIELTVIRCGAALSISGNASDILISALLTYVLVKQLGGNDSDDLYAGGAEFLMSLLPLSSLHRRGPLRLPNRQTSFVEAHSCRRIMSSTINIGWGYWKDAVQSATCGSEEAEAAGNFQQQMHFELTTIIALLCSGDHDNAHRKAQTLLSAAMRHRNSHVEMWSLICCAALDLLQDRPMVAVERLQALHALHVTDKSVGDALNSLGGIGILARAALRAGDHQRARTWAEHALRVTESRPIGGITIPDGYLAPCEVLSTLAEAERDAAERRVLIRLATRALVPAWKYALIFPIGQPRAALVTGIYARMRGQRGLARLFFQRALSTARELAMPDEARLAQTALKNLAGSTGQRP